MAAAAVRLTAARRLISVGGGGGGVRNSAARRHRRGADLYFKLVSQRSAVAATLCLRAIALHLLASDWLKVVKTGSLSPTD
jgi:hypothetical protein